MTGFKQLLGLAGIAAVLCVGAADASAQEQRRERGERGGERGNFDPEQFRQRMQDALKERLEVTDADEWKLISSRLEKVQEAQRYTRGNPMGAFRPRGGGDGDRGGRGPGGRGFANFGSATLPEAEALEKAIESKASADEIKAKLAKLREARKAKEAELEKAQNDLREVLSARQEAIAVTMGLLK